MITETQITKGPKAPSSAPTHDSKASLYLSSMGYLSIPPPNSESGQIHIGGLQSCFRHVAAGIVFSVAIVGSLKLLHVLSKKKENGCGGSLALALITTECGLYLCNMMVWVSAVEIAHMAPEQPPNFPKNKSQSISKTARPRGTPTNVA